ncbi:MAG: dephospho-CoA kinase [Phycisphaerae bacterium]|nr:dephospho-CoA kinase [Phycisphaerae bacterium]MDD5380914.1 dephospho-CoA kinase [Phycisphaerae bacterium]
MNKPKKKPIIGILGGLGSGKTAVATEFARLGCAVIDADKLAHNLLNKQDLRKRIVARFGREILDSKGKISRRKLAKLAFADTGKIAALNKLIHPLVLKQVTALIKKANGQNKVKAIVLDMPLLMEVGWAKRCDKLVFVKCSRKIRVKRAKMELGELKCREKFQISLYKKKTIADNTIDNNSGFSALAGQVTDIFSSIMGK